MPAILQSYIAGQWLGQQGAHAAQRHQRLPKFDTMSRKFAIQTTNKFFPDSHLAEVSSRFQEFFVVAR